MKYACLFFCFLISGYGAAQKKYEKESRINESEFPVKALKALKNYTSEAKRLRFYKETDSAKTSYEAKFKLEGSKYSIEYDIDGVLEDIEIEVEFKNIPESLKKAITAFLKSTYLKYKVKKVQKQFYLNEQTKAFQVYESAINDKDVNFINYEIVIWRSTENESGMVELTFNKNGDLLNKRTFAEASYDHILY